SFAGNLGNTAANRSRRRRCTFTSGCLLIVRDAAKRNAQSRSSCKIFSISEDHSGGNLSGGNLSPGKLPKRGLEFSCPSQKSSKIVASSAGACKLKRKHAATQTEGSDGNLVARRNSSSTSAVFTASIGLKSHTPSSPSSVLTR